MAGACHAGKTATKMNLAGEPYDEKYDSTVGGDMFVLDLDNWTIEHTARSDESGNKGIHTTRSISRTITAPLDRKESQQASADRSRTEKLRRIDERIRRVENTDAVDFDVTLLDFAGQQVYEMSHQ
ncbi:uncharacterized protein LOC102806296, partial [Saccoglossus kowalevskii]|uniref:Uncharacterized protein LOC102806296 n=1 Tax=Saccoglossus kowalevskii TaxID=10224 RepID=A0ABM0MNH4_SACKO